jgi:anti-anti-sigma factor
MRQLRTSAGRTTAEGGVMPRISIGQTVEREHITMPSDGDEHLTVSHRRTGSIGEITVAGEPDIAVRHLVTADVQEALTDTRVQLLRIDVTRVTFVDASGLRSLTLAREMTGERGLRLVLVVARTGPVGDLLVLVGLKDWFADEQL